MRDDSGHNGWASTKALQLVGVDRDSQDPAGKTPGTLWPEQAINLEHALRIFTIDGARALRRETETGSLQVGKSADMIVLKRNLFEIKPDQIADTIVDITFFGGQVVYQK